ncbi:phosphoribosylformylglycinamidine synthase [Antarcticibacterium arcticum]|uniref:Phosphoribosylformylglycinamidine synthase n=1 Tax=Antarcticibacterium arcticum TaxID=2585771 RepID=A0A5B8YFZ2_9FLAO|nr:HAEPLYID family protein [Antarcticibacterium arcticum]QED36902.1 phosphoribosylformylglycinamidine synthase [Antarcticibacterium arcticum]
MKPLYKILLLFLVFSYVGYGQENNETPDENLPLKLVHAEPLYIDLIRDLGARKGEKEWNIGAGISDNLDFDSYEFLVEYEWAVADRLGLEIEIPVTLFSRNAVRSTNISKPADRIESIKLAGQYTFLVSEKLQTSLAFGNIVEIELADLNGLSLNNLTQGLLINPFFVAATRLTPSWHALLYTGPRFLTGWNGHENSVAYEINSNLHYMIPNTSNFIGLEVNQLIHDGKLETVLRPQMRVEIMETLKIGIVPGISLNRNNERFSSFIRLIYEPHH